MNKTTTFVGQHIFSQLLSLSSKDSLSSVFKTTSANKWYKSIKAWDHYVNDDVLCIVQFQFTSGNSDGT